MGVPLTPKMDKEQGFGKYSKYDEAKGPLPETFDFVNQFKITEEQVNRSYEHQLPFHMSVDGNAKPKYSSGWERSVAYHYGMYMPEIYGPTKTADDITLAAAHFARVGSLFCSRLSQASSVVGGEGGRTRT